MNVILNTLQHGKFTRPFESRDTIFWVEGISDLSYAFCYCVDIAVNQNVTKSVHLLQWNCDFFGSFKGMRIIINQQNLCTWWSYTVIVYYVSLKWLKTITTQQSMAPWCNGTVLFSLGVSNDWELSSAEIFETNMYFVYALDTFFFKLYHQFYCL